MERVEFAQFRPKCGFFVRAAMSDYIYIKLCVPCITMYRLCIPIIAFYRLIVYCFLLNNDRYLFSILKNNTLGHDSRKGVIFLFNSVKL